MKSIIIIMLLVGGLTQSYGQNNSDFVSGNKIIFEDDFSNDAIGDFPAKWNTNGSAEITTIEGQEGKWLGITHNSVVNPELNKILPENCTIEFDLFLQDLGQGIPLIDFGLTPVKNILKEDLYYLDKFYLRIGGYNEANGQIVEYGLKDMIGNKNSFPLTSYVNKILHVSMSINKTRIRVYLDDKKLIDLPKALTESMRNNFFINNVYTVPASEQNLLVGNIRIAETVTDNRSLLIKKLLEEGQATTNEILFDVNKAIIQSSSFPILQQLGDALKDNPTLKIKIIGHTDADGEATDNMILSEKRANAVKSYLVEKFKISGERMTTSGMGESQPVSDNTSNEGKAKNRRVEFIKIK
jgi:OOP family OmpA-OmpF porin